MDFRWFRFSDFTAATLYELLAFRQSVLIVEQASPYPDLDHADLDAEHLLVRDAAGGALVGCVRVLPPAGAGPTTAFGRLVVAPERRGTGLGGALVARALARLDETHPGLDVVIGAQAHLDRFYGAFRFVAEGETYDDGGIPHRRMRRRPALRILLVDDDRLNQMVTAALLRRHGQDVTTAETGPEALAALGMTRFDLVLLDLRMPGMDGIETLRRIRSMPDSGTANTPVVMVTASPLSGDVADCRAGGADLVLEKPLRWDVLAGWLPSLLSPGGTVRPDHDAAAAPQPDGGGFDEQPIRDMRDYLPAERVTTLIDSAHAAIDAHGAALTDAWAAGDRARVGALAHKLSGVAGSYGCSGLRQLARELERATDAKAAPTKLDDLIHRVETAIGPALAHLRARR